MNTYHTLIRNESTKYLNQLNVRFPKRRVYAWGRLPLWARRDLRKAGLNQLLDHLDMLVEKYGADLAKWSSRMYSHFIWAHRLMLGRLHHMVRVSLNWGMKVYTDPLAYRGTGGHVITQAMELDSHKHFDSVIREYNAKILTSTEYPKNSPELIGLQRGAYQMLYDYLKPMRVELKALDGRMTGRHQDALNIVRKWLFYTGNNPKERYPMAFIDYAHLDENGLITDLPESDDYDIAYDDDYEE